MRYCTNCHRLAAGDPLFCNHCGRTYDYKLCPSRHVNSRSAQVCETCGSRDLSLPHPRLPFWAGPLIWFLSALPGIVLLAVSVMFLLAFVQALLQNQLVIMPYALATGLLLGVLWWAYMELPSFLRALIRRLFRLGRGGSERKGSHSGH